MNIGIKSDLPNPEGKPLCITLYANKTRLSSFRTTQAYPIMAQLAQLPQDFCNRKGLGTTQVVGWLPIVCQLFVFNSALNIDGKL
jgi:hypothetical protein